MREEVFALSLLWFAIAPAVADDAPAAVFDIKRFSDLGNFVNVEGSPAEEGARPDDTTRWVLWCYHERRECSAIIININGTYVFVLTPIPLIYTIKVWAADRIVAQLDLACGSRETWLFDRLRKTAELSPGSCDGKETNRRTIEDPSWWKKDKERLGKPAPPGN